MVDCTRAQLQSTFLTCPQQEPPPLIDLDWDSQAQSYERHGGVPPLDTAQPRPSSPGLGSPFQGSVGERETRAQGPGNPFASGNPFALEAQKPGQNRNQAVEEDFMDRVLQ